MNHSSEPSKILGEDDAQGHQTKTYIALSSQQQFHFIAKFYRGLFLLPHYNCLLKGLVLKQVVNDVPFHTRVEEMLQAHVCSSGTSAV